MRAPFKRWRPSTRPAKGGTHPSVRWDSFPYGTALLIALDSEEFTTQLVNLQNVNQQIIFIQIFFFENLKHYYGFMPRARDSRKALFEAATEKASPNNFTN